MALVDEGDNVGSVLTMQEEKYVYWLDLMVEEDDGDFVRVSVFRHKINNTVCLYFGDGTYEGLCSDDGTNGYGWDGSVLTDKDGDIIEYKTPDQSVTNPNTDKDNINSEPITNSNPESDKHNPNLTSTSPDPDSNSNSKSVEYMNIDDPEKCEYINNMDDVNVSVDSDDSDSDWDLFN